VILRRGWILVICVLLGLGGGYLYSKHQRKEFRATADAVVNMRDLISNTDYTRDPTVYIGTQAARAQDPKVAGLAAKCAMRLYGASKSGATPTGSACRLYPDAASATPTEDEVKAWERRGRDLFPGGRRWTAKQVLANSTVTADSSTSLIQFAVTAPTRTLAQWLTNGYAEAFAETSLHEGIDELKARQAPLRARRAVVQENINRLKATATLGTQPELAAATRALNDLDDQLSQLTSAMTSPAGSSKMGTAATSAAQTAPMTKRNMLGGAVMGFVIGIGLIFLLEAFDRKVRSSEEVSELLGLSLLARIPAPSRKLRRNDELALIADNGSAAAEAYRKLRVALDFANLQAHARVIVVTSAVEQEGKSTTAANLAVALAQVGRRVVIVDLDFRRPYLHNYFKVGMVPGVTDVALGHISLDDAIHRVALGAGTPSSNGASPANTNGGGSVGGVLHVLTAGTQPMDPVAFLESEAIGDVLAAIRERADVVLIDAPPVLPVSDAMAISARADGMIVVARLDVVQKPVLRELRRELDAAYVHRLGLVLTGAESEASYGYGGGYGYGYTPGAEPSKAATPPAGKATLDA
jgi:receptor protein-tyrosine kinase